MADKQDRQDEKTGKSAKPEEKLEKADKSEKADHQPKVERADKSDKSDKSDKGERKPPKTPKKDDYSYTQNRELSWLRFDDRVLDEALDETVPLFERLKFAAIFGSNLDEWFMIRIGGLSDLTLLKKQPHDSRTGDTPAEQLNRVFAVLPDYVAKQERTLALIEAQLAERGLQRVDADTMTDADREAATRFFDANVAPLISPQIVDPRHPFPNLRNLKHYVTCSLDGPDEEGVLGLIEVPSSLPRVVELPGTSRTWRYTLIEDVIRIQLDGLFGGYTSTDSATIRVTRNADIDPDGEGVGEEEDYRQHMKRVLKLRQRLQPVRLEMQGKLPKELERFVQEQVGVSKKRTFHVNMPLDLGYVYSLESHLPADTRATLLYPPFSPQPSPMVDSVRPMREQVEEGDILLFYPYESMDPLLRLLHEASTDDDCIQIKITLYRVAKLSKLCESLIAASENGKDVTVLMELRARFDEANNILWAERLEDAGCTVIYGQEGFKVHSKICQITYHDRGGISRLTCLGTGNFNEKTAGLYSDFMLLTAHKGIAEDGNVFFRNLSLGNLQGRYRYLGVAPTSLKPLVMSGLEREIGRARAGQRAAVLLKMNSLTDRDVIDKISEACTAGVRITMIIRGICCIRAGVPGKTDGLVVRQIVGRFLEHARVYAFGVDADTIYLSSADMMTRNTEHRVEIAYPVFDPRCRALVKEYMDIQLSDNVKARQLTPEGTWARIERTEGEPVVCAQDALCSLAQSRAREAADAELEAMRRTKPTPAPIVGATIEETAPAPEATATAPAPETPSAPAPAPQQTEPATQAAAPVPQPDAAPSVAAKAAQPAATATPQAAPAQAGRLSTAARLIGQAFATLFGGRR